MAKKFFEWFILIWTSLLVLLTSGWILIEFYGWKDSIVAAIIAFVGAIFGGAITYLGVNRTLKHRDREIFLSSVTEKLMILEEFQNTYSVFLNDASLFESADLQMDLIRSALLNRIKDLYEQLVKDTEKIYKAMDYNDAIEILNFYKKSLRRYSYKKNITKEDADKSIETIRNIFQVFNVSKSQLETKYREYKNEQ